MAFITYICSRGLMIFSLLKKQGSRLGVWYLVVRDWVGLAKGRYVGQSEGPGDGQRLASCGESC